MSNYTVPAVSPDCEINLSEVVCLYRLSVHVNNPLKTLALLTVFLLLFTNVVLSPLVSFLFLFIINTCVWPAAWKGAFVRLLL